MTQNEKELLLKDLSARVPYGVKYVRYSWNYDTDQELPVVETLECVDKDGYIDHRRVYTVDDIQPYLFPLSSMTAEQRYDFYCRFIENEIDYDDFKEFYFENNIWHKMLTSIDDCDSVVDWFNKYHFDYRGLIPMGLAKDATNSIVY